MVWIAIALVCVLAIVIFSLYAYKNKRGKKDIRRTNVTTVEEVPPKPADLPNLKVITHKYKHDEKPQVSRQTTLRGRGNEVTRTYVRYEWQKLYEESIKTPFPDEWSPALPYLYEAHKLEIEGADQQKVQEILEKARQIDSAATNFYITRWEIIKKRQKQN